jgi:SAM-dependent methyltransferase
VSAAYRESFAGLCVGTVDRILDELGDGCGRTLIDVGCGTGTLAFRAAHRGWTVVALDSDPDMVTSTAAAAGGLPICGCSGSFAGAEPDGRLCGLGGSQLCH